MTRNHRDYTTGLDYDRLVAEEHAEFDHHPGTKDLKLGGVHDLAAWHYYWARLGAEEFAAWPYANIAHYLEELPFERPIRVLSLGSGFCGPDIDIARSFRVPYEITCVDFNPKLFAQARERASSEGLNIRFEEADLNYVTLPRAFYHLVFGHAILHHVINLERLFDQIIGTLVPGGVCQFIEVGGQNRTLMTDDATNFANSVLRLLPADVIRDAKIELAPEGGMEGIRQERLLPLIDEHLEPIFEVRHGAFMRFICHASPVGMLDPENVKHRRWLDFLIDVDRSCVRRGILPPLEVWGVYRPRNGHD